MTKAQVLLVAEMEVPGAPEDGSDALEQLVQIKLDAFREAVMPGPEYGISISRATGVTLHKHQPGCRDVSMTDFVPARREYETFSVIEYSSGFAVRHNESGDEHWMSDGVDCMFDTNDQALSPGTPGFTELWEWSLNQNEEETLEAYFPQHVEE